MLADHDLRDTGFIAREWSSPSADRVVSIAVFVDLIISLRSMILTVRQCHSSRTENITVYLLLQSMLIVFRLRRVRIQRGGHCGVGIRCKTIFQDFICHWKMTSFASHQCDANRLAVGEHHTCSTRHFFYIHRTKN